SAAQRSDSADLLVEEATLVKSRPSPQCFAHRFVVPHSAQSLFGSIIKTRYPRQAVEASYSQRDLVVVLMFVARLNEANSFLHIVIIQERDKETSSVPMRTQDIGLNLLAERIHANQV